MEWEDKAFVLKARPLGETGALVELLCEGHGRYAAHVAGGASRKQAAILQPGMPVKVRYRARTSEQLGSANLEALAPGPSVLFDDRLALMALTSAAALVAQSLPEREAYPGVYHAFSVFITCLPTLADWAPLYIRFELGLLESLGFALDLKACAVTGSVADLIYISPKTGRAVSRSAGEAYKERLLSLPAFLLDPKNPPLPEDIQAGLRLTAHFLERFVFHPLHSPLPMARTWFVEALGNLESSNK